MVTADFGRRRPPRRRARAARPRSRPKATPEVVVGGWRCCVLVLGYVALYWRGLTAAIATPKASSSSAARSASRGI